MIVETVSKNGLTAKLVRSDCMRFGYGADEYRVYFTDMETGKPLFFRGPFYSLPAARRSRTRALNSRGGLLPL